MRKRLTGFAVILTVLALLLTTACTSKEPTTPTQTPPQPQVQEQKEGIFYGAWPYDVPPKSHWNVFVTGGLVMGGSPYNELMFNPLMMYYWATDKWEPLLATDYKVDAAKNIVTVTLRKGVKFSDGSDFKAQDVINTLA
ncbi:MAG TPA: ABC transporter substrate-binding protein, partial [Symbiobacteriaceae bacterium]|nr:ABC transporter substrate-binding protein [Symbiobacteriaceae bacterium]